PAVAQIVRDAMEHFNGSRYRLIGWCIMPNHVHLVLQTHPADDLLCVLHSLKQYTARQANQWLRRAGSFWQSESYDHLVRDEKDLENQVQYVRNNPVKAGLENWPWVDVDEAAY